MINPAGLKCQLRAKWSKKEEDIFFSHPLGHQTVADAHLLHSAITQEFLDDLKSRCYDVKTLKFSIAIDWSNPEARHRYPTLWQAIRESIQQDAHQLSLFPSKENER